MEEGRKGNFFCPSSRVLRPSYLISLMIENKVNPQKQRLPNAVTLRMGWVALAWTGLFLLLSVYVVWAADYRPLIGRWQRTDGGYAIEIRRVASDGTLEARYYNPRSIHVARAHASLAEGNMKVEVTLQDVGYPGSTYTLRYDPKRDLLLGLYFQAVQRQHYDVVFTRSD